MSVPERREVIPGTRTSNRRLWLWVCMDFACDYTCGLAVAIAADEAEAKKLVGKAHGISVDGYTFKRYSLQQRRAFARSGGS